MRLDRVDAVSAPSRRRWCPRDCSLYALALGAGWEQLEFVTEGTETTRQRVYPTFVLAGVCAAESQSWPDPGFATGDYAPEHLVLAGQSLELARPVEPEGDVMVRTRVLGIDDKRSGALVRLGMTATDAVTGDPYFVAEMALFVIGGGGFGGDRGPRPVEHLPPRRPPDLRVTYATSPIQTLWYRHAGNDANGVHVDPVVARRAGFAGPILSGQNTLGFAGRAVVEAVAGGDPTRVRSIAGRFGAVGYNGDSLTVEMWLGMGVGADRHGRMIVPLRVVNQAGAAIVDRGFATLA